MNVNLNMSIGCEFQFEKFKEDGEITYKGSFFKNLMLNCGLLSLYSYSLSNMSTFVNIGSGLTAPDASQTGLVTRLFSTNTTFTADVTGPTFSNGLLGYYITRVFQFSVGSCTGDFNEVGLSRLSNSDYLNRQLIKDINGNEVTVRVNSDEGLRITVRLRQYVNNNIRPASVIYKLDTKQATSGNLTISNGTTATTINATDLINATNTTVARAIATLHSNISYIYPDIDNPGVYYIHFESYATTNPNLSMTANTLTGGTGSPTFETWLSFIAYGSLTPSTYQFEDVTAGTTITKNYHKIIKKTVGGSPLTYYPWYCKNDGSNLLAGIPFSSYYLLLTAAVLATSHTTVETPTTSSFRMIRKAYYAPGKLTTTTPYTISTFFLTSSSSTSVGSFLYFDFTIDTLTVTNEEEIEFHLTVNWAGM